MNTLKKITYNCRKATFLIEKKNTDGISLTEHFELRYHLMGCSVCRLFQQQSLLIDRIVRNHFLAGGQRELDIDFKNQLAKRIEEELDEKN